MKKEIKRKNKIKPAYIIGIGFLFIGFILVVGAFTLNLLDTKENPYKEPKKNPTTIADNFVVPESATYSKKYHIYLDEKDEITSAYSYDMFQKHELKSLNFKLEGGNIYQDQEENKAYFSAVIYNLGSEEAINKTIDLEFNYYNDTKIGNITYNIENLQPLESKLITIELDKKYINAFNYKVKLAN